MSGWCGGSWAELTIRYVQQGLANCDSMCNEREVNLTATSKHMAQWLLTNWSKADSMPLLRLTLGYEERVTYQRTQVPGAWWSSKSCLQLRKTSSFWGRMAERNVQGMEHVATCLGLSGCAPLNRPLQNKALGKTTPPSINHSNYKATKREKNETKSRGQDMHKLLNKYSKKNKNNNQWIFRF